MLNHKLAPALLIGAAFLALGGSPALAQAAPQGSAPAVSQPGPGQPMQPGDHGRRQRHGRRRQERHPAMRRAWRALSMAEKALERADHDFNGHRAAALDLVKKAKVEIKAGIESDRNKK